MKTIIVLFIILAAAVVISRFSAVEEVTEAPQPTDAPVPTIALGAPEITGWFAAFDSEKADTSLPPVMEKLSIFSPMLYRVSSTGGLARHDIPNRDTILSIARENDKEIAPLLTDEADAVRINSLLYRSNVQKQFIADLVSEAKDEGFSGWTIDIEKLTGKDRNAFSQFIINTANELHENDLKLYIIAYGRDADETYDPALAHDYQVFGEYADLVEIMTHNYSNEFTKPGGQTPLRWYRSVLSYALETIPKEKIHVGLSSHGNDWGGEEEFKGMTYVQAAELIEQENAEISYDKEESSMVAKYTKDGEDHILMYENARTTIEKMEIARNEFGINKFGIWRLSAEDPEIWEQLQSLQ